MNKKFFLLGLLLFLIGIYISQWTVFGVVLGIGGGYMMGYGAIGKSRAK